MNPKWLPANSVPTGAHVIDTANLDPTSLFLINFLANLFKDREQTGEVLLTEDISHAVDLETPSASPGASEDWGKLDSDFIITVTL